MPQPRKISTAKRAAILDKSLANLHTEYERVTGVMDDLSKDHVDDKAKAKALVKRAKKMIAGLDKSLSA